jgi:hypothetical protein
VNRMSVYSLRKRKQGNQSNYCIFIEQTNMATSQWSDNDESNENVMSGRIMSVRKTQKQTWMDHLLKIKVCFVHQCQQGKSRKRL